MLESRLGELLQRRECEEIRSCRGKSDSAWKMKVQGKQLKTIDFNFSAPGVTETRFVRRRILGCYQYTGRSFLLLDAASVHSLE